MKNNIIDYILRKFARDLYARSLRLVRIGIRLEKNKYMGDKLLRESAQFNKLRFWFIDKVGPEWENKKS